MLPNKMAYGVRRRYCSEAKLDECDELSVRDAILGFLTGGMPLE